MKLTQFTPLGSDEQSLGVLIDDRVVAVSALALASSHSGEQTPDWLTEAPDTLEVIERGDRGLAQLMALIKRAPSSIFKIDDRFAIPVDSVFFLPPVYPSKIIAIGRNYVDHAIEGGSEPPAAPLIFNKLTSSLNAHNAPIVLPSISEQVDYEAELAVVIGRRAKRVTESEALEYIFGYTL